MENLSVFAAPLFISTTLITVWQFYRASGNSKKVLLILISWMVFQSAITYTGFYLNTSTMPPRFIFLLGPAVVFILALLTSKKGKEYLDNLSLQKLTIIHTIRIPIEITLYFIFLQGLIPSIMTFEGWNFDVLSGLTSPIVYYLIYVSKSASKRVLLIWNFICLGLLTNIVSIAILSAKTPFQLLAFDQPNVGVTFFPYVLLPSVVVPIVLVSHLASIRQLLKPQTTKAS